MTPANVKVVCIDVDFGEETMSEQTTWGDRRRLGVRARSTARISGRQRHEVALGARHRFDQNKLRLRSAAAGWEKIADSTTSRCIIDEEFERVDQRRRVTSLADDEVRFIIAVASATDRTRRGPSALA